MEILLDIKNLSIEYKSINEGDNTAIKAVKDVSLKLQRGEIYALAGESGCGKSTLLHIIGGVDKADSGRIFLDDNEISSYDYKKMASYRRKQVSIIYQFYNLLPVLNVVDNIILPLKLDNRKVDQQYLDELLQLLQLNDKKNAYPSELSGGQQQRVAIARSLITRPKLLLADEPTGNLDSENSKIVVDYLKKIHHQNDITIIMVTHDLELAKNCDRIYVLEQGKLREYET